MQRNKVILILYSSFTRLTKTLTTAQRRYLVWSSDLRRELKGVTPNYWEIVSRLMKVNIVLESTQAYATRLVSYVNGLCTPRNNASANALVNIDSLIYYVHKLAYYRHDMPTYITLFCLQMQLCCAPMHSFALLICSYLLTHT